MREFSRLKSEIMTVGGMLSGGFRFRLPWFQRAYAWRIAQAALLLADIRDAMGLEGDLRYYSIGSVILAKNDGDPDTAIVDGHQRLMTLTILFAVLRDLEEHPDHREKLAALVIDLSEAALLSSADPAGLQMACYRLQPQPVYAKFMHDYVQADGATLVASDVDIMTLAETEKNILENRDHFRTELSREEMSAEMRRAVAGFLINDTYLNVRTAISEDEAWKMLSVEEERRHTWDETACLRASLLDAVPSEEREAAGVHWDRWQRELSAAGMHELLAHIRAKCIGVSRKPRNRRIRPLESEIAIHFELDQKGLNFFEKILPAHAELYLRLKRGQVGSGTASAQISKALNYLNWFQDSLWIPVALRWLEKRGAADRETALFFERLERLAWFARLSLADTVTRSQRLLSVLAAIDDGQRVDDMKPLRIEARLKKGLLEALRVQNFRGKAYAVPFLRRVSVAMGQPFKSTDPDGDVTIEHVLPRGAQSEPDWKKDFTNAGVIARNLNRLGNLTYLKDADNQAAANHGWQIKQPILANSDFVLSQEAGRLAAWTPSTIKDRTEALIAVMFKAWDLKL